MKEITMSKRLLLALFTGGLLALTATVQAEQNAPLYLAADSALENTELNARDKNDATLTPEDQMETESDIKITVAIRKAAVNDDKLSLNAQNVKIITRSGVVTLRGPVENEAENKKLYEFAKHTPGVVKIDNQLELIKAP